MIMIHIPKDTPLRITKINDEVLATDTNFIHNSEIPINVSGDYDIIINRKEDFLVYLKGEFKINLQFFVKREHVVILHEKTEPLI